MLNESRDQLRQKKVESIKKEFETTKNTANLKKHFAQAKLASPSKNIVKANIEAIHKKQ